MKERGRPRAGPITRFLLWCGAVDPDDLASRTETYRYSMLGAFVLLVALLAAASCTVYIAIVLGGFHPLILAAAALWAVIIFALDRSIVSEPSYGAETRGAKAGRVAFFGARIAIAIVVAWLIGDALVLTIFRPEITEEIAHVQQAEAAAARQRVIGRLDAQLADLDRRLGDNKTLRDEADQATRDARRTYVEERRGISGTGLVGDGPAAREALTDYREARQELRRVRETTKREDSAFNKQKRELTEQIGLLRRGDDQAVAAVPGLKAELDAIRGNNGWLAHLRGLSAFLDKNRDNPAIASLPWLLRGLFVAIDLVPLTMKVLNRWTLYGRRQRDRFDRHVNRDRLRADLDRERDRLEFTTAMARESWRSGWRINHMRADSHPGTHPETHTYAPRGTNGAGHGR